MKRACDEPEGDSKRVLAGDREPIDYERDLRRRYQWAENRNNHETETVLKYFNAARLPEWLGCNNRTAFDLMYPWLIEVLVAQPPPYLAWIEHGHGWIRMGNGSLKKLDLGPLQFYFSEIAAALVDRPTANSWTTPYDFGEIPFKKEFSWFFVQTGLIEAASLGPRAKFAYMSRKVWLHLADGEIYGVASSSPVSAPHKIMLDSTYAGRRIPTVSVHLSSRDMNHVQAYFNQITNTWHPSSIEFYT